MSFQIWALLSAFFAGLTAILSKKGVQGVPSNLAVAVRVVVVLVFAVMIAIGTGQTKVSAISSKSWAYLAFSGIATGASWLCYFKALDLGPVSRVAPIDKLSFVIAVVLGIVLLHEKPSLNVIGGAVLIVCGVLVTLR